MSREDHRRPDGPGGCGAPTPVLTDSHELARWLLGRLGERSDALSRAICDSVLRLLSDLALAARHRDLDGRLLDADDQLVILRTHLRLAMDVALLDERRGLFALEQADRIGRQIGGWMRSLDNVQ